MANKYKEKIAVAPAPEQGRTFRLNLWNIFKPLNLVGKVDSSLVSKQLPFMLFLVTVALGYIYYNFRVEQLTRDIDRTGKEIKELRSEYIESKSELMRKSNQSTVADKVGPTGLKESVTPPGKLLDK
ncbi:MAG: hypothetical protein IPO27_01660 [Bacteroidetes bacterium]|nr:hypothetical protein [Bacteroidota bacterium]